MNIPYRTRQTIKRVAVISLIAILVLALVWLCWFVWLKRFVVYTRDGAVLDFSLGDKFLRDSRDHRRKTCRPFLFIIMKAKARSLPARSCSNCRATMRIGLR